MLDSDTNTGNKLTYGVLLPLLHTVPEKGSLHVWPDGAKKLGTDQHSFLHSSHQRGGICG
jgi:hypothetical protein